MINGSALLTDLRKQVAALENDLRDRADSDAAVDARLRQEWADARTASRTAATFEAWRDGRVTQAAVAWVLGTVFLRYCEDNRLIELPFLAGPGERLDMAAELQADFVRARPATTDRDWILAGFRAMSVSPVVAGLFDFDHNPMWSISRPPTPDETALPLDARWDTAATRLAGPSHSVAQRLLAFWRTTDANRQIIHDFTGEDTRFLGDLYQDLSEYAKKTYALLQTPEFVEEFILDHTLEPALNEFHDAFLDGDFRLIDPTCGSGHFLLGAFKRLLAYWEYRTTGADKWDLIVRTLRSVHGVDKNPFAAAIARFRLLVAALDAGEVSSLDKAPEFPINIAVADTLLFRRGEQGQGTISEVDTFLFADEDANDYVAQCDILAPGSYHVVVGNPPYITVRDKTENRIYREHYATCHREYALSVPFAERFFDLALRGPGVASAGFVGQITANSFMKREFGKKLIEGFFVGKVDLTYVIDTSGAYIPGHGTPTVILIGRNQKPSLTTIRTVMGIQGEPMQPAVPSEGKVWQAIKQQIDLPGTQSRWVGVDDLARSLLATHPWSLAGGGAIDVTTSLERSPLRVKDCIDEAGLAVITGEDSAYVVTRTQAMIRKARDLSCGAEGTDIRDWRLGAPTWLIGSYTEKYEFQESVDPTGGLRILWPLRDLLWSRKRFSVSMRDRGATWHEWREVYLSKLKREMIIAFPLVATHNHFYLGRKSIAFKHSAPVITLPEGATEDQYLELLGVLNSSTACFWLKQVSHNKGSTVDSKGARQTTDPWENFYEFTGTKLQEFPLPAKLPLTLGREMDRLAQELGQVEPSAMCMRAVPTRSTLDAARVEWMEVRGRMLALQEELDWEVYRLYGLLDNEEAAELRVGDGMRRSCDPDAIPRLNLGERAFEIVLARRMSAGEIKTQWFVRHGSTPITEIPTCWPERFKKVIQKRIEIIEKRRDIALIERPEYKRRWAVESWEKREREALTTWLLDRCEQQELWFAPDEFGNLQPRPMSVDRLADKLRADDDVVSIARLLKGPDADLADVLEEIMAAEHVPYLASLRYKDTGLRKRAQWEQTWKQQREEDATGQRLNIPVPPKYGGGDFRKTSYWRNRGKLDVPKERFISYENAGSEADTSLLLGWAGWDHREQAHALMTLIEERGTHDLWESDLLTPLIAGLREVLPWVKQWHAEIDPDFGDSWANAYTSYLEAQQLRHNLTDDDLLAWRPVATTRGRKKKA
ncbi:BREX-2 system adenine-specific DNA-methyltransferase PglX [Nonomuraea sp. NPDC049129]|uniref:BREX-2 system adenine-specific DNA-methyltransferase PglX n=1 Tax=Nonomuraea sp. NPDC049129 TaxID=3155272 RepID=UPI0033D439A8